MNPNQPHTGTREPGPSTDRRIYSQRLLRFERGEDITISFEGKPLKAFTSEPVAVALFAAGMDELGRSMKFHRPRGPYCFSGKCSSCLLRVDGVPNVKSCQTLCEAGMAVQKQQVLQLMGFDPLSVVDKIFRKRFDYHGMFAGVKPAAGVFQKMVRTFSTGAHLPEPNSVRPQPLEELQADVAVVGAGPAGTEAALEAAGAGLRVVLVDENMKPGGHLLADPETAAAAGWKTGDEAAALLKAAGVTLMTATSAIACFNCSELCLRKPGGLCILRPRAVVFATGGSDRTLLFEDNDLPRVMSGRAVMRLINQWGVAPGSAGVVGGKVNEAARVASALDRAGIRLAAAVLNETEESSSGAKCDILRRKGAQLLFNSRIVKAYGGQSVERVFAQPQGGGRGAEVICDFVAVCAGIAPAYELPLQAGCDVSFRPQLGGFSPVVDRCMRTSMKGVFAAGELVGAQREEAASLGGRIAGAGAAIELRDDAGLKARLEELIGLAQEQKDG